MSHDTHVNDAYPTDRGHYLWREQTALRPAHRNGSALEPVWKAVAACSIAMKSTPTYVRMTATHIHAFM